jgi:hypothetical protein
MVRVRTIARIWRKSHSAIAKSVADKLLSMSISSDNLELMAASAILSLGVDVWYTLAHLTPKNSNQLGEQDVIIQASGPQARMECYIFIIRVARLASVVGIIP